MDSRQRNQKEWVPRPPLKPPHAAERQITSPPLEEEEEEWIIRVELDEDEDPPLPQD